MLTIPEIELHLVTADHPMLKKYPLGWAEYPNKIYVRGYKKGGKIFGISMIIGHEISEVLHWEYPEKYKNPHK